MTLLLGLVVACSSDPATPEPPALPDDLRELYTVEDKGHRELVFNYLNAIKLGDAASAQAMLSPYALNEISVQHGSFDAYLKTSRDVIGNDPISVRFNSPWVHHTNFDKGEFFEVWFAETRRYVFYMERDASGRLTIDNILVNPRTRLFVFDLIAPAFGLLLEHTNIAFMAYYYGAIFGEHPVDILAEIKGQPATDKERLAYLRLSSSPAWIEAIKDVPEARNNVLLFLNTGREQLKDFSEPIPLTISDKAYTFTFKSPDWRTPAEMTYGFVRQHGVYRVVSEEQTRAPLPKAH